MSSCRLMFPGVRSSLVFSGFGLWPPASGFQSYFYSSLKTSPSVSTIDKTSRLKMKSFSTVRDTQRGTQSYMEKRRGRRGDPTPLGQWGRSGSGQEEKRPHTLGAVRIEGESKGPRQIQPVISSLSVLHSPEHTKRFTELGREEKGREEIEATWWRKRSRCPVGVGS